MDSFNPTSPLRKSGESSRLWSPREPHAPGNNWKPMNHGLGQSDSITRQISILTQEVANLKRQRQGTSGMHPFKIYQFPQTLRKFHNSTDADGPDWRRFKVRGGMVFYGTTVVALQGQGTDSVSFVSRPFSDLYLEDEIPPSDNTKISPSWHEVVVPADGNEYYFWYSMCVASQVSSGLTSVCFGSSATGAKALCTGETVNDPWPSIPIDDPYHKLIGSVMIFPTDPGIPQWRANEPVVFQRVNTDITFPKFSFATSSDGTGSVDTEMNFRGVWNAGDYYYQGDVVTQVLEPIAGRKTLKQYVLSASSASAYSPGLGPVINLDPSTNNPDPWVLFSESHVSADYHVDGSYQAASAYLRT